MKRYDYHTHNGYTKCVDEPWLIDEGWRLSKSKGIERLGISNHVHFNDSNQDFLFDLKNEIDLIGNNKILLGVELDIDDPNGRSILRPEILEILDYVIAAPHNQPINSLLQLDLGNKDNINQDNANQDNNDKKKIEYFNTLRKCLINSFKSIHIDIWAHPFLQEIEKYNGIYWEEYLIDIYLEAVEICANRGIAIEISAYWHRNSPKPSGIIEKWVPELNIDKNIFNILNQIYSIAVENNDVLFSLGTDAHALAHLGNLHWPLQFIKKFKIPDSRIIDIERK